MFCTIKIKFLENCYIFGEWNVKNELITVFELKFSIQLVCFYRVLEFNFLFKDAVRQNVISSTSYNWLVIFSILSFKFDH